MNPEYRYTPPSKFTAAARTILRFVPAIYLFGIFLYAEWRYPQLRATFNWPVIRHGLWVAGLLAVGLMAVLAVLTVIVFAFNADWHTSEGFAALLRCLFIEAVAIGVIAGLVCLIVTMLSLG